MLVKRATWGDMRHCWCMLELASMNVSIVISLLDQNGLQLSKVLIPTLDPDHLGLRSPCTSPTFTSDFTSEFTPKLHFDGLRSYLIVTSSQSLEWVPASLVNFSIVFPTTAGHHNSVLKAFTLSTLGFEIRQPLHLPPSTSYLNRRVSTPIRSTAEPSTMCYRRVYVYLCSTKGCYKTVDRLAECWEYCGGSYHAAQRQTLSTFNPHKAGCARQGNTYHRTHRACQACSNLKAMELNSA